ncbi:MAG: alpha/beta hydrolase [Pleurocapsa sp.]
MKLKYTSKVFSGIYLLVFLSFWLSPAIAKLNPALGAETIKLIYGPFNGNLSVDCLRTYAETGEITREFRIYARFLDQDTLIQLRQWLQKSFDSDHVQLYRYTHSPEGEELLKRLGEVIRTHPQRNGFYALRSALIEAADKPGNSDGWTIIEAMQKFPTENLQIDTKELFKLQKFWQESQPAALSK